MVFLVRCGHVARRSLCPVVFGFAPFVPFSLLSLRYLPGAFAGASNSSMGVSSIEKTVFECSWMEEYFKWVWRKYLSVRYNNNNKGYPELGDTDHDKASEEYLKRSDIDRQRMAFTLNNRIDDDYMGREHDDFKGKGS